MGPPTTDEIAQTDREIKQAEARFGWGSVIWGFGFGVAAGMAINPVSYTHLTLPTTPYV